MLRRPILNWGATDAEARAGYRATNCSSKQTASRPVRSPSMHPRCGLALDRADGPFAARRRVHLRLDREPARPRTCTAPTGCYPNTSIRRSATRSATGRTACASSASTRPRARVPIRGRQLGLELVLDEQDGKTRLISRNRFRLPSLIAKVGMLRWSRLRSSWSERCFAASSSARNGLQRTGRQEGAPGSVRGAVSQGSNTVHGTRRRRPGARRFDRQADRLVRSRRRHRVRGCARDGDGYRARRAAASRSPLPRPVRPGDVERDRGRCDARRQCESFSRGGRSQPVAHCGRRRARSLLRARDEAVPRARPRTQDGVVERGTTRGGPCWSSAS